MAEPSAQVAEAFRELRPLLFSIAYRMLGSVAEAEDVVQEAFVRYQRALGSGAGEVASPKAYLSAVTTRLAIDHLRSARVRRERYVGTWLPEPLLTGESAADTAHVVEDVDSLAMAFLLVLDRLAPVERAVFLLHDVFDFGFGEIAAMLDLTEANCRQLAVRSRRHVDEHRPRFETSARRRAQLADRFFAAVADGDVDDLAALLAEDAVVVGDGGGRVPSWRRPIVGRERVVHLLGVLGRQTRERGVTVRRVEVNGQPGAMFLDPAGRLISVMNVDVEAGRVRTLRSVINPDKLAHLGELADVRALLRAR